MSQHPRRLGKTIESLSHGLILALTELKDLRGRSTTANDRKTDDSGVVDALTATISGLSTIIDHSDGTLDASAPDATPFHPPKQPIPTSQRESATQHINAKFGALSVSGDLKSGPTAEPNNVVDYIATGNDSSLSVGSDWSPISGLHGPPEVFRFLKWAEAYAGLRSTQLFDLSWVADTLFHIHGGVRTL